MGRGRARRTPGLLLCLSISPSHPGNSFFPPQAHPAGNSFCGSPPTSSRQLLWLPSDCDGLVVPAAAAASPPRWGRGRHGGVGSGHGGGGRRERRHGRG